MIMRSTFKTVFYVNGSKEKNGMSPSWDGLQSTGLSRSQLQTAYLQGFVGCQRQQGERQEPRGGGGELCAGQHQGADNEALPAAF